MKIVKAFNPRSNSGIVGAVPAKPKKRRNYRRRANPAVMETVKAALIGMLGASITRFVSATGQAISPVQVGGLGLALAEGVIGFGIGWAAEYFKVLNSANSMQLAAGGVGVGIAHGADYLIGNFKGQAVNTASVVEANAVADVYMDENGNYYDGYGNMLNDVIVNPYFNEHDFYGTTSALGDIIAVPPGVIEV